MKSLQVLRPARLRLCSSCISKGNALSQFPVATTRRKNFSTEQPLRNGWTKHSLGSLPKNVESKPEVLEKPWVTAYIALGSNLGDRVAMIEKACGELASRGINVIRTSSLWETEPKYVLDQESFINAVIKVG